MHIDSGCILYNTKNIFYIMKLSYAKCTNVLNIDLLWYKIIFHLTETVTLIALLA